MPHEDPTAIAGVSHRHPAAGHATKARLKHGDPILYALTKPLGIFAVPNIDLDESFHCDFLWMLPASG
jgi:hypothetical protein